MFLGRAVEDEDDTSLLMLESNDGKVHDENKTAMQTLKKEENRIAKIWNLPRRFIGWFQTLKEAFGLPIMIVVMIVYGVAEGYVGTVKGLATNYYWKDVQKLQPASTQAFEALVGMPWNIKPIYGIITDAFPIAGFQRWPYLAISGILGACSLWLLSMLSVPSPWVAAFLMACSALSTAFSDVVVDATVAERSRMVQNLASDLQSLSWGSLSVGGLIGCAVSGAAVHYFGPRGSFLLISIAPLMLLIAAKALPEKRVPRNLDRARFRDVVKTIKLIGQTLKEPNFWRPALYIYLSKCLCPDISEALFYWFTDPVAGPGFGEEFIGFVTAIAYVAMVGGIALYNCWLQYHTIRSMFFWPQVAYCIMGLVDMVIVCRWNLKVGIPDHVFVIGDEAVTDVIGRLQLMPLMVLSAKMCPEGIEGTVFALLMSVANVGGTSAEWAGAMMLRILKVRRDDYTRLWMAVLLRALLRLTPLLFLRALLPAGCLNDLLLFASSPPQSEQTQEEEEEQRRRLLPLGPGVELQEIKA